MIESLLEPEPARIALVTMIGASLLALVALIGARFIRHAAGLLHKLLAATLFLVLALPLLSLVAPAWFPFSSSLGESATTRHPDSGSNPSPTFTASPSAESPINGSASKARSPVTPLRWIGGIWLAGLALMTLRRVNDHRVRRRMLRNAVAAPAELTVLCDALGRKLGIRRPTNLRLSVEATVPMTWGVGRPVVLLPWSACSWEPERIRIVLLHELAHIARLDAITRSVADAATLVHWYNPLVINVARALRRAAEQASDDLVLRQGVCSRSYVNVLIDLARSSRSHRLAEAVVTSSELERRVTAIIDTDRGESRKSAGFIAVVIAIFFGTVILSAGIGRTEPRPVAGYERQVPPGKPLLAPLSVSPPSEPRDRQSESRPKAPEPAGVPRQSETPGISTDVLRRMAGEAEAEFTPRLRRMLEAGAAPERVLAASSDLRTDAERQALLMTILDQRPDLVAGIIGELGRFHSDAALQKLILAICSRGDLSPDLTTDIVSESARLRSVAARTDTIVAIASTQALADANRIRLREIALGLPSGSRDHALTFLR